VPEPSLIARLEALDDEAFGDLVFKNLPAGAPPQLWEALLSPELVHRTKAAITDVARDLMVTVEENKAELSELEYRRWLGKVGKPTRTALDERRAQARTASLKAHAKMVEADRNDGRRLAVRLAVGIAQHRAACAIAGLEPEPHDKALWSLLDSERVGYGDQVVTPAEMLERGIWRNEATG